MVIYLIILKLKRTRQKINIRQAVGQLFEYSMYLDKPTQEKLIIVIDTEPSIEVSIYIKHLRDTTTLNLHYRWVDMQNEILLDEI